MAELTGGELIARVLREAGVAHAFTLCDLTACRHVR
jgi:hypothetical protein